MDDSVIYPTDVPEPCLESLALELISVQQRKQGKKNIGWTNLERETANFCIIIIDSGYFLDFFDEWTLWLHSTEKRQAAKLCGRLADFPF